MSVKVPVLLQELQEAYQLAASEDSAASLLAETLAQTPSLGTVLAQAPEHIRYYFPGACLSLEARIDPEIDDVKVLLMIDSDLTPREAVTTLSRLNREWGLGARQLTGGSLVIGVRPR